MSETDIEISTFFSAARWASLSTRMQFFYAARSRLGRLCDLTERSNDIKRALLQLFAAMRSWAQGTSLNEATFASVAKDWTQFVTGIVTDNSVEEEARSLLSDLRQLITSIELSANPIGQILDAIAARCAEIYGNAWRSVRLEIYPSDSHPRSIGGAPPPDPFPLTATTECKKDPQSAIIRLTVCDEQFGPPAYAVLPILLTHECVSHVPAQQDVVRNDSEFAEGFLDWAAYFFLERWIGDIDAHLAPVALAQAEKLKQILFANNPDPGLARQLGHEAAQTLAAWFQAALSLDAYEARVRVARIAVELNAHPIPLADKERFVSALAFPLPGDLAELLARWVDGRLSTVELASTPGVTP